MPPRSLTCPECGRVLGTISRKYNQHGRRHSRIKLNGNVEQVGRSLFRGRYAECRCGEKVRLPDDVTVEFH